MASIGRSPCDEGAILGGRFSQPCAGSGFWVLAATILGSSLAFIDGTVVNVALPALQSGLHATIREVQWVVESYALFLAALLLVGGSIGDLYGRRKMFAAGMMLFARGVGMVRDCREHQPAHHCAQLSRRRRGVPYTEQPRADQRFLSAGAARPGNRDMVWLHGDYDRDWPRAWRMAGPTCILAMGLLHQSAARAGRRRAYDLAGPGKRSRE